ncbi:GrpB family protein [Paenibacillus polymyxa]|uniref:GrpB family protein n=1 Tax=Paenibacillus polymyxa TaxID=1406 RepID=UPI00287F9344|nr:GrpB family protein [Paenibacillus polymyxa]
MSSQVEISGYDPQWAEEYTREQGKIVEALRDVCVGIEHIGSTSVPNLGAGTHHLHIYKYKGEHWENHLLFRDYLKVHPDSLRAYDTLKKGLAYQFKYDRAANTEAKGPFIRQVVERAKLERYRQGQMNS